ncbi:YdgA family protein [Chromohalobacter canadensis]|uniref:YdgA family protein n=1 Tax=Chromohalobacter canadensis TaxID=141389 RepID=UPI0021C067A9|nr:YdgA family protein [Chromohalobacter canadensis]MCT8468635.1 YdgA family protein [Chromohalobacter canadensis]MCT8471690.1 YdgA family protein [Chromohalobacter canadensis]MCT8499143.1 YdgA family protein [Chromohalobacter canadensis]
MHKKRWIGGGCLLLLLGIGWCAAQAWSSHVGEQALERLTARLDARDGWQASRHEVEQGWWHSSGVLRLETAASEDGPLRVALPYRVRHGVLSSHLDGEAVVTHAGETLLAADSAPTWQASYRTLSGDMKGRLEWPAFTSSDVLPEAASLEVGAGELMLRGHAGDVRYHLRSAPWRVSLGEASLDIGAFDVEGRHRGDARTFQHTARLSLATLTWQGGAPFSLNALNYEADMRLDDDTFGYHGEGDVADIAVAGQSVASGRMSLGLERVDADALRALVERMRESSLGESSLGADSNRDVTSVDETSRWGDLTPLMVDVLRDSPRLTLETLQVTSEAFGVDSRAFGELTLDGDDSASLAATPATSPAFWRRLQQRLDGQVTLVDAPALLALHLGLPPETPRLVFRVDAGQWRVNERALRW